MNEKYCFVLLLSLMLFFSLCVSTFRFLFFPLSLFFCYPYDDDDDDEWLKVGFSFPVFKKKMMMKLPEEIFKTTLRPVKRYQKKRKPNEKQQKINLMIKDSIKISSLKTLYSPEAPRSNYFNMDISPRESQASKETSTPIREELQYRPTTSEQYSSVDSKARAFFVGASKIATREQTKRQIVTRGALARGNRRYANEEEKSSAGVNPEIDRLEVLSEAQSNRIELEPADEPDRSRSIIQNKLTESTNYENSQASTRNSNLPLILTTSDFGLLKMPQAQRRKVTLMPMNISK